MAITYSAGAGSAITSFLVTQALGDQSQQTGNNTIVIDNVPSLATGYGGNVGDGTLGVGDSYVSRRVMIGRGGTVQERIVTSDVLGTGSTRILTVHEDWDTNPVATTDTADVFYEIADVEDGGAGGGISFATRTGLWTLTRIITVGDGTNPAGLDMHAGQALEQADRGVSDSLLVRNNGFLRFGYYSGGLPISGGVMAITSAENDEPSQTFESGADVAFLDTLIWAQVATLSQISNTGAKVLYDKVKLLKATQECELYGDDIVNLSISGESKTTEIVRVDSATTCQALELVDIQVLDSAPDTTTETITLEGVVFSGVAGYVDVRQNKTWNLIDPVWDVTIFSQLTWTGTNTGNALNDRTSVKATVAESDGTLLQDAIINVYENTRLADLVLKLVTDVNGYAEDSFIYLAHLTNIATATYGGHALQAGKWLYLPFIAAQSSSDRFAGTIVLSPDNNIVQTNQATALTNGSGVTWSEPTNATEIVDFTLGSGTLAVGMVLTFSPSGAIGTIRESASGDSVSGELYLDVRNATAIADNDTFSRTGGTAGTFSGTYTNGSKQSFSISINGNSLSYQTVYDYIAALTTETILSATGELIWEWCRSAQSQALYAAGSSFYTEQSNGKGVYIYGISAGTLEYYTDDAGLTWIPPSTTTVTFTGMRDNTEVRVYKTSDGSAVAGIEIVTGGTADNRSFSWSELATLDVYYKIFHEDYEEIHTKGFVVPSTDTSIPIQQRFDRNNNNPL